MKMNFINFCDAKIFKSISTSSSTSLQLPLQVVRHEDWWRKTFAILWMENEVIGNESKFIRLIFFVHFFTFVLCACLTVTWGNFHFQKSLTIFNSIQCWKFFQSEKKEEIFLKKNEEKFTSRWWWWWIAFKRPFITAMHVRLTAFECSCSCFLFPLMLIFDAWKTWNEF